MNIYNTSQGITENHRPAKILVVDDIKTNVSILKLLFKDDYDVRVAYDGKSALEQVAPDQADQTDQPDQPDLPDLILLDIEMPGIDGYEVCRRLKADKHTQKIMVVFITSKDGEEDETKGLELGAIDYITKPFRLPIVKARVKNLIEMKKMQDTLENLSSVDGLTGIHNRRFFEQTLLHEWKRAIRAQAPLSLIMMDIDYFKKFNDHYGHPAGDECLKSVARTISGPPHRSSDFVARYGGEEFVAVLPDTEITGALTVGERIGQNVRALQIPHMQSPVDDYVTISAGIATMIPTNDQGPFILIEAADKALYRAKKEGRNACRTFPAE